MTMTKSDYQPVVEIRRLGWRCYYGYVVYGDTVHYAYGRRKYVILSIGRFLQR